MQNHFHDFAFPLFVEVDLRVEPTLKPLRVWQLALHCVVREHRLVHMQIGRVQRFAGAATRRHQESQLRKARLDLVDLIGRSPRNRLLQIFQVGSGVTRFVLGNQTVDVFYQRLGMPFARAAIPMIEPNFAAEMHHQRFERRRRVKLKAHVV